MFNKKQNEGSQQETTLDEFSNKEKNKKMLEFAEEQKQYLETNCIDVIYANDEKFKKIVELFDAIIVQKNNAETISSNISKKVRDGIGTSDSIKANLTQICLNLNVPTQNNMPLKKWLAKIRKKIKETYRLPNNKRDMLICVLKSIKNNLVLQGTVEPIKINEESQNPTDEKLIKQSRRKVKEQELESDSLKNKTINISESEELKRLKAERDELAKNNDFLHTLCGDLRGCGDSEEQRENFNKRLNKLGLAVNTLNSLTNYCNTAEMSSDTKEQLNYLNAIIREVRSYNSDKNRGDN